MRYTQYYKLRIPEGPDYYDVEDFNNNTQTIDTELNRLKVMIGQAGSGASEQTITLPASSWNGSNQQTITVEGATDNSTVLLGIPTGVTQTQYTSLTYADIIVASTSGSSITLQAYGVVPSIDVPVSIVLM